MSHEGNWERRFKHGSKPFEDRTIADFWKWDYSDLMQNVERGVLAEYIVAVLLGVDDNVRVPWTAHDLKLPNGVKVEVKTVSLLQAWYQKRLSNPMVVIKPTRRWDPKTNVMEDTPKLHSDLYVICFFTADNHDTADPLDIAQWRFYVLTKKGVLQLLAQRKSFSLSYLKSKGFKPKSAHELKDHVMKLCK